MLQACVLDAICLKSLFLGQVDNHFQIHRYETPIMKSIKAQSYGSSYLLAVLLKLGPVIILAPTGPHQTNNHILQSPYLLSNIPTNKAPDILCLLFNVSLIIIHF
jgi:hypothetical protein